MGEKKRLNTEIFVRQYALTGNGKKAAMAAGSTEKSAAVAASRMLKKDNILARVREEQKRLAEEACISEQFVLLTLKDIMEKCMAAQPVMEWDPEQHCKVETGEYVFDSKGALKAAELIGEYLGIFTNNVKLSGAMPVQIVDDLGEDAGAG